MQSKFATLFVIGVYALGCDDVGGGGGVAVNPYDNAGAPQQQAGPAAAQQVRVPGPRVRQSASPEGVRTDPVRTANPTKPTATPSLQVKDVGAHAVTLKFSEYAKMTRQAREMLEELTKIHITVDETADAEPYQDRWGELTADLAQLYADTLVTGYPPQNVVEQLNDQALPQLKAALDAADVAMTEHSSVESGIDRSYADAKGIYEHMAHLLTVSE